MVGLRMPARPWLPDVGPENPQIPGAVTVPLNAPTPSSDYGEVPPLHRWDANGDVFAPPNAGAESFVPAPEAVPPQLPGPLDRRVPIEFEPHGIETVGPLPANADLQGRQLGFIAHSVCVDNFSPAWLYFPAARTYVPPYTWRAMLQMQSGASVAQYMLLDPYGVGQLASTAPIVTIWYEDYFGPSSGTDVSGQVSKGQINVFSVLSVSNAGAGTPVLLANPARKSAFFQNLGANQIDLGPDNAALWTPAANTGIRLNSGVTPPASFNDTTTISAWRAIATTGATNLLVIETS